ncbi:MAG: OmpA family protein [Comamonadaceae bacterium]|nr:OmpA family protein [Comamonadaceae bacterium]
MLRRIMTVIVLLIAFAGLNASAKGDPEDQPGSKDPAPFDRMSNFFIYRYEVLDFDKYEFPVGAGKSHTVEGTHTYVHYYGKQNTKFPSGLQIVRNYQNAVKAIGGQALYEYDDSGYATVVKMTKGDTELWAHIRTSIPGDYDIHVIEKKLMNQTVTADAASLSKSISDSGRVAIYGIYFDTAKSDIKPESKQAIGEIAKMLSTNSKLKVYVVGHTDNVGAFDANIKLSSARATAVVNALVSQHSIAAARLIAFGAGPVAPVASNSTDESRSKNRRVELVQQ